MFRCIISFYEIAKCILTHPVTLLIKCTVGVKIKRSQRRAKCRHQWSVRGLSPLKYEVGVCSVHFGCYERANER